MARHPAAGGPAAEMPRGRLRGVLDGTLGRVCGGGALERPPAAGTFCSLCTSACGPFDAEIPTQLLERARFLWPDRERGFARDRGAYGSGERAFVALDCEPPRPRLPRAPAVAAGDGAMIGALVRKELRQLLPLIVGLAALLLWGIVDSFLSSRPTAAPGPNESVFAGGRGRALDPPGSCGRSAC